MLQSNELTQAIAAEWDRIALALGAERTRFEAELIPLLRQLETTADDTQRTITQILALFETLGNARELLQLRLQKWSSATRGKGSADRMEARQHSRCISIPVFFATNRAPADGEQQRFFGADRGTPSYGIAHVSIPDDHRMGRLERPHWWKLHFREDDGKHVVLQSLHSFLAADFSDLARSTLSNSLKKDALVFVHGFNVSFQDGLLRCAQIAYDLHFEGIPILYSWPSEGEVLPYAVDGGNVEWSQPHFTSVLTLTRSSLGAEGVHILAHSMGNRLLTSAIASFASPDSQIAPMRQIIFAAPDVDAAVFKQRAAAFSGRAQRFTLYASSEDKALKASKKIHKYPRAGESGLDLVIVGSVDTIDASLVDTNFLGHSYFGDTQTLLSDMFYLIRHDKAPNERFGLDARSRYGSRYWTFRR